MNYWTRKTELATKAKSHAEQMSRFYPNEINECVEASQIFTGTVGYHPIPTPDVTTAIIIEDADSVSAMRAHATHKTCVLNFASYKEPGGKFMEGSSAQEESLCHASILYNVLSHFDSYYYRNKTSLNRALYRNRAIYTPNVLFFSHDHQYHADVLTCAAPNKTAAQKYANVSDKDNSNALRDRIDFMLSVAASQLPEVLILGAYGCGVFGQDPTEVASIFKDLIHGKYKDVFKFIVFAIPDAASANYQAFRNVFTH